MDASGGRVDDAVAAITGLIRAGDLQPGDRLPSESALSRDIGVSRPVVREAFRALAAMRIVTLGAGRRATVAEIDAGPVGLMMEHGLLTQQITLPQVYDVRRTIEGRVAALAATRRTDAEAREATALAAAMREAAGNPDLLRERDLLFHMALARAARNPLFLLIAGAFEGITRQTWPLGWRSRTTAEARERMVAGHEAIAAAVARGDPAAATAAMDRHFDESVRALHAAGLA